MPLFTRQIIKKCDGDEKYENKMDENEMVRCAFDKNDDIEQFAGVLVWRMFNIDATFGDVCCCVAFTGRLSLTTQRMCRSL